MYLVRQAVDEHSTDGRAVGFRAEHERSPPDLLRRRAGPRRRQDEDERSTRLRGAPQITGHVRHRRAWGLGEVRDHCLRDLDRLGQEDPAGRLDPADAIQDALLGLWADALDRAKPALFARLLELANGRDSERAAQGLDALETQLGDPAQLGGARGEASAQLLERPRRARPVKLCNDLSQTRADAAKLGQPSLLDEQGDISAEPLEGTSGPVVCAHLEGRLTGEAEQP